MKITVQPSIVKRNESMIVAFDVGKDKLNALSRVQINGQIVQVEDELPNGMPGIIRCLRKFGEKAGELGLKSVHVVCEPTGGYERKLIAAAHKLGYTTEYVSGEAVHRCEVVESNDSGKSDHKDPGTIHTLACLGKTLHIRHLSGPYLKLRRLNEYYDDEDKAVVSIRTRLHAVISELFVDWSMRPGFLYTGQGEVIVEKYGCSPYRILAEGWGRFVLNLRQGGSGFRMATAKKVWECAQSSVLHCHEQDIEQLLVQRVQALYSDWERHEGRREAIKTEMIQVYETLPEAKIFSSLPKQISRYLLARVVAETGAFQDFSHIRQLWRFAGLNLRERSSGKYTGELKISKKGRSLLRKVLYQIAYSHLITRGGVYATWYKRKKQAQANGLKSIVAVMRHFLNCLHAMARSSRPFALERLFEQEEAAA